MQAGHHEFTPLDANQISPRWVWANFPCSIRAFGLSFVGVLKTFDRGKVVSND